MNKPKTLKEKLEAARRQGEIDAFAAAQKDVLETMADDLDDRANILAEKKLHDLLVPVDMQSIVTLDKLKGIVYIGGEKADASMLANLKAEADFFAQSNLWKVMYETPKRLAEKAMFVDDGELENQLLKGRAILYMLDAQKNIIETFRSYTQKK